MGLELRVYNRLFIIVALTTLAGFGCSQGSDIRLQGPMKPAPQDSPTTNTSDTSNGDSGQNPSAPKPPVTNPPSANPIAVDPTYRMFCDERYPPYITTVSSLASPAGLGAGLDTGEPDARGKFDPASDRNLEYHENPQVVTLPKSGDARIIFSARKTPAASNSAYSKPRYIFLSDIDISLRGGVATRLATEIVPSNAVRAHADLELMSVRTFGASDGGRFILIGQADGYRILDSKTLKAVGTIKSGSADSNVNPELRESDMIFSVGSFKGAAFESKLYSLGFTSTGALAKTNLVASVSGLRRPLQSIGPAAGESFAALDGLNRIVTASPLLKGGGAKWVTVRAVPKNGRLSSAMAAWRDATSKEIHAVVVYEHFSSVRGGISGSYKIEQVFVRIVNVNESSLMADAIVPDLDYPFEARTAVEQSSSLYRKVGVSEMSTAPDGKAIFGLFPGGLANNVYRLTSAGFVRVSRAECSKLDIGVEPAFAGVQP